MDGSGSVRTSSPTSPTTDRPSSSHASIAAPRARPCSSPSYTGSVGTPPTKALTTSVPPEVENSQVSAPTCSYTHRNPSGDNGEPVEPTAASAERSRPAAGSTPAFMHAPMYDALVPKVVMRVRAAKSHSTSSDGYPGDPS